MKKIEQEGKVTFIQAIKDFFIGYVDFSGRTTRAGYWWVQLVIAIIYFVLFILMGIQANIYNYYDVYYEPTMIPVAGTISFLFSLGIMVPTVALSVRRIRDVGLKSKAILVVYITYFALLITCVMSQYASVMSNMYTYFSYKTSYDNGYPTATSLSPAILFFTVLISLFIEVCMILPTNQLQTESDHPVLLSIFSKKS